MLIAFGSCHCTLHSDQGSMNQKLCASFQYIYAFVKIGLLFTPSIKGNSSPLTWDFKLR